MTPAATKILKALNQEISQTAHVSLDAYTLMWRTGQNTNIFVPALIELIDEKLVKTLADDLKSSASIKDKMSIEELASIYVIKC